MVRSKAAIGGHPIHPALVAVPIGLLTGTVLADLAYLFVSQSSMWLSISFWTNAVGVATALIAAIFGFIDYFAIARGSSRRTATAHMVLNLVMVAMFSAALLVFPRPGATVTIETLSLLFGLQFGAFALMMMAGYLGGELVFKHKLGVDELPRADSTRNMQPEATSR